MFRDAMTDLNSGESLEAGGSVLRFSLYSCFFGLVGWSVKHVKFDHAFATPLSKVETKIAIGPGPVATFDSDLALVAVQVMWMLGPSSQHIRRETRRLLCHFWPSVQLRAKSALAAARPGHTTKTHVIMIVVSR